MWENKGPAETAADALAEAQFYIEGLRKSLPNEPALPFIAAGFNGKELRIAIYTNDGKWVPIKVDGQELRDSFPKAEFVQAGIAANGVFTAGNGAANVKDLRALLPKLKTLYRNIATLSSGRTPIDFTVAILTLKLIVEQQPDWGSWSEMPRFSPGAQSVDHAIGERFETLAKRVLSTKELKGKYGDIFDFHEKSDTLEVAFSFVEVLGTIEKGQGFFLKLFDLLDQLPPLAGADFDIFGEVYQAIGDEATKKKLGEFFTGRHIIAGVLPILFSRAGFDKSFSSIRSKKIADLACGTGGFLTEMLRRVRNDHHPSTSNLKAFAQNAFFGYDIGHANASRARVNMYFAGDGFSSIRGGFDSLAGSSATTFPKDGFDIIATNPPYGTSNYGRIEEAFLLKALATLKKGTGWLLIVLPTGVLENPRSAKTRFALLDQAMITDVISLPKHAFAPYTQQRTAIVIAQRRKKPLVGEAGTWQTLATAAQHENINMFIVDNDGFANSDKRYPTDKRAPSGEWMHDDLSEWIDSEGFKHPSKLFQSLVNGTSPAEATNEFGEPLGPKHGVFHPPALLHAERGIVLLPDIPLRAELKSIPFAEWKHRADQVEAFAKGDLVSLPLPFAEEVEFLLDHGIEFDETEVDPPTTLDALFKPVVKGDTGLTEAMIYQSASESGSPVYGGGRGVPRFKADDTLKRDNGAFATKFNGPALVVSMDGSSGSVQVIEKGSFFCNHHGAVLLPSSDVNLWCFAQVAEPALRRLASNVSASATLTKPALEGIKVRLPIGPAASEVEKRRRTLISLSRLF
nr:hypothetical protein BDOA9_0109330 [Bradyrhizobium sp. DOA9]